ncbi:hypothetical protein [Pararcticibacter amylolyticus]|uniref:hypothetical protein n=1 Tax=Pararcticibacter amylolyticus TaxID=2173175 RepID=UPI0011B213F1|nr:hypothetical protein [Pararcticibacter amylolyticus]
MATLEVRVPKTKVKMVIEVLTAMGVTVKHKNSSLTTEEEHIISALQQADLLNEGKLETTDARKFLDELR